MILKALKNFRDKTYQRYEEEHKEDRPQWMDTVMEIHEQSEFLFYFDDYLDEKEEPLSVLVRGELVRGTMAPGGKLYLYTGEGELLGTGKILTLPEEKEEGRRGLLKRRRNEFRMEITSFRRYPSEKMDHKTRLFCLEEIYRLLSLISDVPAGLLAGPKTGKDSRSDDLEGKEEG